MDKRAERLPSDAWQIGLLFVLWLLATGRLRLTEWTDGLYVPQVLALCGLLVGLGLGYGRFRPWLRSLLLFGYTVVLLPWQLNTLQPPANTAWLRLLNLSARLHGAWETFWRGQEVTDPLLFLAAAGTLAWCLAAFSGYAWGRCACFLAATLPPAALVLLVQVYDPWSPARMWFLAFFLLAWLVLLARHTYLTRRLLRVQQGITDLPDNLTDVHWLAVRVAIVLLLAAWLMPPFSKIGLQVEESAGRLREWWQQVEERLEKATAPLESNQPPLANDYYGKRMALGRGTPLREDVLFTVEAERPPNLRYYWRGYVYDTYESGYWYASTGRTISFQPTDALLSLAARPDGGEAVFRFVRRSGGSLIYAPPDTAWVGRPAFVDFWPVGGTAYDISAWRAQADFYAGETYLVRAWTANPTVTELRAAGQEYPDWVRARYLQVPENFSPRLQELALRLAEGQPTPYDVAQAVTDFLRQQVAYTPELDIPSSVDPLEWAILDARQAFCNYYASAEVLMLRSLGIPARMAVGFAQGVAQGPRTFQVRWLDAHAWPEVYFPGYGWVIFEPTAGQPPLERPLEPAPAADRPLQRPTPTIPLLDDALPTPDVDYLFTEPVRTVRLTWLLWLLAAAALTGGFLALRQMRPPEGWNRSLPRWLHHQAVRRYGQAPRWLDLWLAWALAAPIERMGWLLTWFLGVLSAEDPAPLTPRERIARLKDMLPEHAEPLERIASAWVRHLYSSEKMPEEFPPDLRQNCIMVTSALLWLWMRRWPRLYNRPRRE